MSSQLAVGAITCAVADVIQAGVSEHLADATVTTLPPARANENNASHLNLFLYRVSKDAAFANTDWPPTRARSGERGRVPLALNLHYLLTPYGQVGRPLQPIDDMLLGYAMSALHDNPVLEFAEILAAASRRHVIPVGSELPWQTEGVRISFDPLSADELTKLWATFQGGYRTSVGYQASVALIDSGQPTRAPIPVRMRGFGDRGAFVSPSIEPFPFLETISVRLPAGPAGAAAAGESLITSGGSYRTTGPSAVPDSMIVIRGQNLQEVVEIVLVAARTGIGPPAGFGSGIPSASLAPDSKSATELFVTLPADVPAAGRYLLTARCEVIAPDRPDGVIRILSNSLPVVIGTKMTFDPTNVLLDAGIATIAVTTQPPVIAGQEPLLLLGSEVFTPENFVAPNDNLRFRVHGLKPGEYQARVRIDGMDSQSQAVTLQ